MLPFRAHARAFTLVELLVVIVIVAILIAIAIPLYLSQQTKAQDMKTKQYLNYAYRAIKSALPESNNAYPQSTSLVSAVQVSEPGLTVSSGDCLSNLIGASINALIIDAPSRSANNLTLCAKSQSGNLWKLTASATSAPQLLDASLIPLTVSGNEITDTSRAAKIQGDGLSSDSSTGIWETTTNRVQNGGFATTTGGGWGDDASSGGGVARTLDSTTAVFGSSSLKVVTAGTGAQEGTRYGQSPLLSLSPSTTYTASAWLKGSGTVGFFLDLYDGSSVYQTSAGYAIGQLGNLTLTGGWQRYTFTFTTGAAVASGRISIRTQTAQAITFWIDGVQLEQKPFATPYVETNGSTASRAGASVHISSTVVDKTQGWAAARIRVGWSSSNPPEAGFEEVFRWTGSNGVDTYSLMWRGATRTWEVARREIGGGWTDAVSAAQTFAAGSTFTLIAFWTSNTLGVSVNGGSFTTVTSTPIPSTMSGQDIYFGSNPLFPERQLDGEILWEAVGTGTLSNADAATINGWGSSDPKRSDFPSSAQATLVWAAATTNASLK